MHDHDGPVAALVIDVVHGHELEAVSWGAFDEPLPLLLDGDVPVPLPAHSRSPGGRVGRVRRETEGPQLSGIQRGQERRVVQGPRLGASRPHLRNELGAVGLQR